MTGIRRHGREKALQLMVSFEGASGSGSGASRDPQQVADEYWAGTGGSPALKKFAGALFFGAAAELGQIDPILSAALQNWKIERLSPVDRNLLRLAIYELRYCPDVPPRVVLNEYIEVAKKFGETGSGSLMNGVLDAIYKKSLAAPPAGGAA